MTSDTRNSSLVGVYQENSVLISSAFIPFPNKYSIGLSSKNLGNKYKVLATNPNAFRMIAFTIVPALILTLQCETGPLPLPIRTSVGFVVIGMFG